jgi:hypothetical protein
MKFVKIKKQLICCLILVILCIPSDIITANVKRKEKAKQWQVIVLELAAEAIASTIGAGISYLAGQHSLKFRFLQRKNKSTFALKTLKEQTPECKKLEEDKDDLLLLEPAIKQLQSHQNDPEKHLQNLANFSKALGTLKKEVKDHVAACVKSFPKVKEQNLDVSILKKPSKIAKSLNTLGKEKVLETSKALQANLTKDGVNFNPKQVKPLPA